MVAPAAVYGLYAFTSSSHDGRQGSARDGANRARHDAQPGARLLQRDCRRFAASDPARYITSATLAKRRGQLFLDYFRNGRGTTAIGTYSPRARSGFPITAPVTWKQLERGIKPNAFRMV